MTFYAIWTMAWDTLSPVVQKVVVDPVHAERAQSTDQRGTPRSATLRARRAAMSTSDRASHRQSG